MEPIRGWRARVENPSSTLGDKERPQKKKGGGALLAQGSYTSVRGKENAGKRRVRKGASPA